MKLVVSRAATADLARLHDFLAGKNQAAARRAVAALIAAASRHSVDPSTCCATRIGPRRTRSLFCESGTDARRAN